MSFAELGLSRALVRAVDALNYTEPTPVQAKAIPVILKGRDVVALAETGSGKTASYLLPILQQLELAYDPGALIIAPTRELALQIDGVARELAKGLGIRVVSVIGGQRMGGQLAELKKGVDLLVATPGRLLDLVRGGHVRLHEIEFLVLDEADRLLDMGFIPDIRSIIAKLPKDRQSMLFSATFSNEVEGLVWEFLKSPVRIEIGRRAKPVDTCEQTAYSVMSHHKTPLMLRLADEVIDGQALVFTETKRGADKLARVLKAHGHEVETMHADRSQKERVAALNHFRDGKVKFLVATDVAARGIDVDTIEYVVNYDVPSTVDSYVHRIGRTARAGRKGTAITLFSPLEESSMRGIESVTGQPIARHQLENFDDGRPEESVAAFIAGLAAATRRSARASAGARGGRRR
jgi:ATP-dependent RNA helicase RhlE